MRIGIGYDIHRTDAERDLVLGGVTIEGETGLEGHSDADVVLHAIIDALLGALGAGDLGSHFPSSDARWRGASGAALLAPILERVDTAGLSISNVDSTVIAQEPRLAPHLQAIREGLAAMLRVPPARVNVKLKSTDGLGALGRGEGIAAQAVVLLVEPRANGSA